MSDNTSIPATAPAPSLVTVTHLVYALHALSLLIGITTAASIIGAFVFGVLDHCRRHQLCKAGRGERHLPGVALSLADPDVLVCSPLVYHRRHAVHHSRGHPACDRVFSRPAYGPSTGSPRVAGATRSKADVYEPLTADHRPLPPLSTNSRLVHCAGKQILRFERL